MSQRSRVLAALRSRGADGITQVDFLLPDVIDGGAPITRVGARVYDLREEGHRIDVIGERDGGCAVYRLMRDTQDAPRPPRPSSDSGRVAQPVLGADAFRHRPRNAIFDDWEDVA